MTVFSPSLVAAAAVDRSDSWVALLFRPEIAPFLIPITAILVVGIVAVSKIWIRHRERMAMIERGLHPDYPPETVERQESR